jgi:hypothetical protein
MNTLTTLQSKGEKNMTNSIHLIRVAFVALFAVTLLTITNIGLAANGHQSQPFKGPKANTGFVTYEKASGKQMLMLSDDFKVPIWCAWAEALLGEAPFDTVQK